MGKHRRHLLGETRLLMEYLTHAYPDDPWLTNIKVGTAIQPKVGLDLTDGERRMFQVYQRFPDAVIPRPHELVVLEACVWRSLEKVGQLLQYLLIVPYTVELKKYLDRPLIGEILTAQGDAIAEKICRDHGIRYTVFAPSWLDEFYAVHPERKRRAPAPGTMEFHEILTAPETDRPL